MKSREDKIKSQVERLRTNARKLNVHFTEATEQKVYNFLERREGKLPTLEINKHGTVYIK